MKQITYNAADRDFSYSYAGELIGFAPTRLQAEAALNEFVYGQLVHGNVDAADLAPDEAEAVLESQAALIEVERQGGVDETRPVRTFRQAVDAVLVNALATVANNPRWTKALERASANLDAVRWQFDGAVLRISSATSTQRYWVDAAGQCDCPAGQKGTLCWHKASWALLRRASEATA